MELTNLSAGKLAALMRGREVSPVEVVEAYLRRIERLNPGINAIVTLAPDAFARAREAESAIMRGQEIGSLHGVPVTVKDTIETKGLKTTSGSPLRKQHVPGEDAPAVASLKAAGAILIGKTNVPEMAIPYECDNPVFGRTNNPHDTARTSGGSSGGCAAAISACLSPAGLGSDLSGSIRVPAHFCGIFGLKPTIGRVSCDGHFPPATGALSLGAVLGPMARHVEDLSLFLNVLTGLDAPSSVNMPGQQSLGAQLKDMRGCRVASYVNQSSSAVTVETQQAIDAAMRVLAEAGFVISEESPPGVERAAALWPALFSRASMIQLRGVYTGEEEKAGAVVRAVLASADKQPPPSLDESVSAWTERDRLRLDLFKWMKRTPLIIAPVGAVPAFRHGTRRVKVGEQEQSVFHAFSYARAFNVLGLPCVSVPVGRSREGLPIGVQIIGRPFAEETVLAAASVIEDALGGWMQPPGATMA
ncbi:MAG: amidase [Acidobacteriota bacterium]|jgi:amidase|nr:amidase [Acidobacteriota bacterium]